MFLLYSYQFMFQGLGLRPGVIDGAISISAVQVMFNIYSFKFFNSLIMTILFLIPQFTTNPNVCLCMQWLCNADKSSHDPRLRLKYALKVFLSCFS